MTRRFNVGLYGGGNEPAAKGALLSWRDDPDETLSDWRIEVNVPDAARNSKTYHVHKVVIAGGPRKSDYFVRQCRGNGASRLAEAARGESKLDLDAEAAEALPAFLDYVYTGELQATKENACALFHLAEYTANPSLHAEVKLYLEESLDYTCAPTYIAHAHLFSQDKLIDAAVEAAAEQLQLYADHVFLPGDHRFDPATADNFSGCPELHDLFALHHTLFARVVTSDHRPEADHGGGYHGGGYYHQRHGGAGVSWCVVRLVADYCTRRADASFLEAVVDESFLDNLGSDVAMPLLEAAMKHPGSDASTKLRDRCIQKAGEDWKKTLLPLAQKEKRRREEQAAAEEAAAAHSRKKKAAKRTAPPAASSSETVPAMPLGPGLPADMQLKLLGDMLLQQGGEDPFD